MSRLTDITGIPPWLWRPVVRIAVWHALFVSAVTMTKSASNAVFLAREDPSRLPVLYVVVAIMVTLVTSWLARFMTRVPVRRAFVVGVNLATVVMGVSLVGTMAGIPGAPAAFYVMGEVTTTAVSILFWARVADAFSVRDQKRVIGIISAGGMAGAVIGGVAIRYLATSIGVLVPVLGAVTASAVFLPLFRNVRARPRRATEPAKGRAGLSYLLHAAYPMGVAALVISFAATGAATDFVFRLAAASSRSEAEMAGLFGVLNAAVGVGAVLFQVTITGRLLARVGIFAFASLIPALLALAAIVAYVTSMPFELLLVMKGLEMAGAFSIYQSAVTLLYNPMPTEVRSQVRAVVDGSIKKGGAAVAGILLALLAVSAPRLVGPGLIFVLACASLALLPWLRRQYLVALHDKLGRRKRQDSYATIDPRDRVTQQALLEAIDGSEADRIVAALHALGTHAPLGNARLVRLLAHDDAEVRELVLRSVSDADAQLMDTLQQMVKPGATPRPRAAALRALFRVTPERTTQLFPLLLDDEDPAVVMAAIECGLPDFVPARARLDGLVEVLPTLEPSWRTEVARLLGRIDDVRYDSTLMHLLDDDDVSVQRGAIEAAGRERHLAHLDRLVTMLAERRLRTSAREALVAYQDAAVGRLSAVLDDQNAPLALRIHIPRVLSSIGSLAAARALLFSNPRDDAYLQRRIADRLIEICEKQGLGHLLDRARCDEAIGRRLIAARAYTQVQQELTGLEVPVLSLLRRVIDERQLQNLRIAFQLLGLHRGIDTMMTVYRGLSAGGTRTATERQDALELLDASLGGDPLRPDFLALLEREPGHGDLAQAQARVDALCRSRDPLVRAVARHSMRRLGRGVEEHGDYLPVGPGAEELEGEDMADSLVERLFLLEHVDLFEGIAVDDLAAIAAIASEASFAAGQTIYRESDQGDSMFVIVEGEVELTKNGESVLHLIAGETLGQVSFLDRGPRPVTAQVSGTKPAKLLVIERGIFLDLLADRPGLMHALFSVLAQRIRSLIDRDARHEH